jgi:hypothetical protein
MFHLIKKCLVVGVRNKKKTRHSRLISRSERIQLKKTKRLQKTNSRLIKINVAMKITTQMVIQVFIHQ